MPFFRKYGTGTGADIHIPIIKRGVVDFAVSADWTPAAGDVKISIDGAAAANIGTLPTALTMGNGAVWKFVFSDAELQGKKICVTVSDSATKAVEDQSFLIETYGNASAQYQADLSAANLPANVTQLLGTAWLTPSVAGTPDVNAKQAGGVAWGSGAITAAAIAASALNGKGDWNTTVPPTVAAIATAIMTDLMAGTDFNTAGSFGKLIKDFLDAAVSSRSTYDGSDTSGITTLLSRLTSARAGYLDNLNVGGAVASQADITALNQSASRRVILTTVQQYERPESSSSSYTIEARTYDGDGAAVNADTTPTLTATGIVSGSLAANLSAASNPATGVYRWTYTVASGATIEQIRFDVSADISSSTFTLSAYSQVVDEVSQTWTSTDASHLTAIYNKLPSKDYLTGTANADGDVQVDEATGTPADSAGVISLLTKVGTPTGASLADDVAAVKADSAAILDDTGTSGVVIATATQQAIADVVLGRSVANCESTAAEWSLCTIVLATLESAMSGTTWTIKRTDGTTTHYTKTLTADAAADPVTGVS